MITDNLSRGDPKAFLGALLVGMVLSGTNACESLLKATVAISRGVHWKDSFMVAALANKISV